MTIVTDLRNKEMSGGVDDFGVEAGNDEFFQLDTVITVEHRDIH